MPDYTQETRRLVLETPLGADVLIITSFNGREEMSRLSVFHIDIISQTPDVSAVSIIGKNVGVNLPLPDGSDRWFNGFVSRFACSGSDDRFTHYRAEIVPWLWFLTRTSNCFIFQEMTVVQIIQKVFSAHQFSDFTISDIQGTHPVREYCVQYRESDFNFVSRLMEEEGIFYYIKHEKDKHTVVLADQAGAYKDVAEAQVTFTANLSAPDSSDLITHWEHRYEFRSGASTYQDYNFLTPANDLTASTKTVSTFSGVKAYELYDYPGRYEKVADGTTFSKVRMQEVEVACEVVAAGSSCRSFGPGGKFTISNHHLADEGGKAYVITGIEHSVTVSGSYATGRGGGDIDYKNNFECIPDSVIFRPERRTPKPFIRGAQTAFVCGPSGQEIYVDQYGRIKVQFFWDRIGMRDEKSSCWIRVAQTWAGNKWGAFYWPRVSQEVVVSFLEGDPDRPLVTGSVYNANRMPPYTLPDEKTKSGVKTDSSMGSGGFNELRFEDKKGSEQVFIHGEKDQDIRIKNDCKEWIGHDRHLVVINNKLDHVENDHHEKIDRDHLEAIGRDLHTAVTGKEAKTIGSTFSLKVADDVAEEFQGNHSEQVTGDYYLKAENIVIEGMTSITIKVGQSYIAIDSTGVKIGTTGTMEMDSTSTTTISSSAPLSIKSQAQAQMQAPMVEVQGQGMLTLKGGLVMIN